MKTQFRGGSSESKSKNPVLNGIFFGVPEGIRTPGLLIRSQTLYPAELQVHPNVLHFLTSGGGREIRTLGKGYPLRRFSKPLVSTAHPSLRASNATS